MGRIQNAPETGDRANPARPEAEVTSDDPARDDARPGQDSGTTFVELVISVVLIGLVVISILTATRAGIVASSVSLKAAKIETVLLNAADRVDRATIRDCDYHNEVSAGAPDGFVITVHEEMLVDSPSGNPATDWIPCAVPLQAFDVERMTITATNDDGSITRTMTVVKSDVD